MRDKGDIGKSDDVKSFGLSVREELLSSLPQASCCRKSFLHGMLINAENGYAGMVMCRFPDGENGEITEAVSKLLREHYGREPEIKLERCYSRLIARFEFESKKLADFLADMSNAERISDEIDKLKCSDCKRCFLAGVLSTSARFCDPQKEVRLEIRINDPARAERVACFFSEMFGEMPGISARSGVSSLIIKKISVVQDVLLTSGAQFSAMELMQVGLLREFRGNVNRASNCEVRNIGRVASAAASQLSAIAFLREGGWFSIMPEELKETAELRESEPEASLAELASKHSPPITKSGVSHRIAKICELAEKYKSQK